MLPCIILVLYARYRMKVSKLIQLSDGYGAGSLAESESAETSEQYLVGIVSKKLRLAIALGRESTRYSSWVFMFTFLLYPVWNGA